MAEWPSPLSETPSDFLYLWGKHPSLCNSNSPCTRDQVTCLISHHSFPNLLQSSHTGLAISWTSQGHPHSRAFPHAMLSLPYSPCGHLDFRSWLNCLLLSEVTRTTLFTTAILSMLCLLFLYCSHYYFSITVLLILTSHVSLFLIYPPLRRGGQGCLYVAIASESRWVLGIL
jgi:hypothetical protein